MTRFHSSLLLSKMLLCIYLTPSNSCIEISSAMWWCPGVGTWGGDELVRVVPSRAGLVPSSQGLRALSHPLFLHEDIRGQLSANQEERLSPHPDHHGA
jgi:hypothetical protein